MEDRMHRGIPFVNVFRVTANWGEQCGAAHNHQCVEDIAAHHVADGNIGASFRAEDTLTVNSGADVPKATIVSPITILGMRKRLATDAAPSVSPFAPNRMRRSPPIS